MIIAVNEPPAASDAPRRAGSMAVGHTRTINWNMLVSTSVRDTGDRKVVFARMMNGEEIPMFSVGGDDEYISKMADLAGEFATGMEFIDLRTKIDAAQ